MPSAHVRQYVKHLAETAPGLPFFDSVSIGERPNFPEWFTLDWGPANVEKLTYCDERQEVGSFDLVFFGPLGAGDLDLVAKAEAVAAWIFESKDPAGVVTFLNFTTPQDWGMNQNFYTVVVSIEYANHLT